MADSVPPSSQGDDSRPTTPTPRESARPQTYHFQWELASRRKGPSSVISETTESRTGAADTSTPRADVFFENMSTGSATPSFPTSWSASTQGFNAISTVLNNPKAKPNPLKASKAPQPPVHSPDLKRIRRKDFDPYLKTIGPAWQRFEQSKKAGHEAGPGFGPPNISRFPSSDGTQSSSLPGTPDLGDQNGADVGPRSDLTPLSSVPSVYFNPSFDLSDPRTFASVTDQGVGTSQERMSSSPTDIALNHILQEKMSHYMDVVEQHLVREIAIRSVPFFAALSNLQDLQTEGAACLSRIARLKTQLHEVDSCQARRGLQVIHLQTKRDNIKQLQREVKNLREVGETIAMAKHLEDEGDHFEALGLTESVETLLENKAESEIPPTTPSRPGHEVQDSGDVFSLPTVIESPDAPTLNFPRSDVEQPGPPSAKALPPTPNKPRVDLTSLASLSELPSKLANLRSSISVALQKDLLALLVQDHVDQTANLESSTSGNSSTTSTRSEAWMAQLRVLLDGLLRTSGVERASASYKDVALAQIRMLVRAHQASSGASQHLPEHELESNGEDHPELVKDIPHDDFMRLMRSLYATLLNSIQTTQEHGTLIQQTIGDIYQQNQRLGTPLDLSEECSATVFAAAELASVCAAKLLNARAEQNVSLPWPSFLELYNETSTFNINSEILCRTMIIALRGAANSQAKAYLSTFHSQRISESAKLVEEETWSAVDVPPKYQRLVQALIEAAVSNPPELMIQPSNTSASNGESSTDGPSPKYITIEDQHYHVVDATLQAIRLLVDYLSIIANLPLLTIDVMPKIIEFLKAFNSRTCQVVLGAGALRSAGLKNITARHLALASQSLTVMVTLIPYVRETFRRHLSPKQAVMLIEFDKLKRDFQEHQNEIYAKLISIMGDRLAVHCKSLHDIDWAIPSPKPPPNSYMEVLVKETATLHKVLTRYLSGHASELIMSQIFAAINHRLSEEYGKIDLPSQEAKDRLLEDAKYLHARLSALPGVGGLSSMLETVVSDKRLLVPATEPVETPVQVVPPPKPARRTLSSIFGKDTKVAPKTPVNVPAALPEKPEAASPGTQDIVKPPGDTLASRLQHAASHSSASIPHEDVRALPEEEQPRGKELVDEQSSVAPTEAVQPETSSPVHDIPHDDMLLLDGTEARVMSLAPDDLVDVDSAAAARSHSSSPGGDQQLPNNGPAT
ncbi:Vps54-domain-containing protein [Ceratobasidium sp. AG-I]|nr:Vps54-domain-containing protein [Ceratobasidium sp. AG-I]